MAQKKYISLSKLSTFLDNLKTTFASLAHSHTINDITDYKVDTSLSSTSANPVENRVLDAEFEAIATSMSALESVIDDKADASHIHDIGEVNELQTTLDAIDDTLSQKSQVQIITPEATEVLSTLKIHKLTQEEYDEKVANGEIDETALYLTPNEEIDLSGYVTTEQLNAKADANHNHNDIYYTETEIDELLNNKANTAHNHDSLYDVKGSANSALQSAKDYADSVSATMANTIKNDLLNGAGTAYDTLKELGDLIDSNVDAINALESIASGKADTNHNHDDRYYTESEIDGLIASHNHDSLYDAFGSANIALENAKTYTDNTVAQKSQVQIVASDVSEVLPVLKIHKLTQEEYDEKIESGDIDENALYLTPDEEIDLSGYATIEQLNKKSDIVHSHDDVYYTESEVDILLADKASISHNHDSFYDAKGSADNALVLAKEYTDSAISGIASASHTHNDIYYTESEIDEKIYTINDSISNSVNEAKSYSNTKSASALEESKTYTDNAISQKSQVQIIIWEADD